MSRNDYLFMYLFITNNYLFGINKEELMSRNASNGVLSLHEDL